MNSPSFIHTDCLVGDFLFTREEDRAHLAPINFLAGQSFYFCLDPNEADEHVRFLMCKHCGQSRRQKDEKYVAQNFHNVRKHLLKCKRTPQELKDTIDTPLEGETRWGYLKKRWQKGLCIVTNFPVPLHQSRRRSSVDSQKSFSKKTSDASTGHAIKGENDFQNESHGGTSQFGIRKYLEPKPSPASPKRSRAPPLHGFLADEIEQRPKRERKEPDRFSPIQKQDSDGFDEGACDSSSDSSCSSWDYESIVSTAEDDVNPRKRHSCPPSSKPARGVQESVVWRKPEIEVRIVLNNMDESALPPQHVAADAISNIKDQSQELIEKLRCWLCSDEGIGKDVNPKTMEEYAKLFYEEGFDSPEAIKELHNLDSHYLDNLYWMNKIHKIRLKHHLKGQSHVDVRGLYDDLGGFDC